MMHAVIVAQEMVSFQIEIKGENLNLKHINFQMSLGLV
jgi:hypothetical protein